MRKKKLKQLPSTDYELLLIQKIEDCNAVLKHLDSCPAWAVITKDLEGQRQLIDANWHLQSDEKQLREMRITKFAVMHLLEIKNKYVGDLEKAEKELTKYQSQDTSIMKDYDTETTTE